MPPATAGPGPSIDAPRPATPFTVSKARLESNSHSTCPVVVEYARSAPSTEPENTTPGITVNAADCAPLQPRPTSHSGCGAGVTQIRSPVTSDTACRPPGTGCVMSDTAK